MSRSPRGIALISILFVVVLFSALAFQLYTQQSMATAQTRIALEATQMRLSLLASEALAIELLREDWQDPESRLRDDLIEPWAQSYASIETVSGSLRFQVFDLAAKLNLNALTGPHGQVSIRAFNHILNRVGVSSELVPIWRDWVDADDKRHIAAGYQGREELDWLSHSTPFRTANGPAGHLSEINMLFPLASEVYEELAQFVVVLPHSKQKLNVNTAPSDVLNALLPPEKKRLGRQGGTRNFGSVAAFTELNTEFQEISDLLSVNSEFFEVRATLVNGHSRMDLTSHILRDNQSGECHVFAREFGTRHAWST